MTGKTYKSFISYSHVDQKWAAWLHRAIESYRVPRDLRTGTMVDDSSGCIRPVFRDCDELAASQNLTDRIVEALQQSESMIVICSPAAVQSQWVDQEIRAFQKVGRSDRIFCVVVNGDPTTGSGESACFPKALSDNSVANEIEPLAADPRKWADGKRLAKLKVIAGLLGVGLDQLGKRDLKRRRVWRALVVLALLVALGLSAVTVGSLISQRIAREKAEQLATFIVDLGERMQSDVDLETLATISEQASGHLETLDFNKLTPETAIKVGLAVRQLGYVSQGQGRSEEALVAYQRSKTLFLDLLSRYPDNQTALFEVGQAEFYVGNTLQEAARYSEAVAPLEHYHAISVRLNQDDPANNRWILELSYAVSSLVALHIYSGEGVDANLLADVSQAVELIETAQARAPDDMQIKDQYGNALAWAAEAQTGACNLEQAMNARLKSLELSHSVSKDDPTNNELKLVLAFTITGVANMHRFTGQQAEAQEHLERSIVILEELAAGDPSNVVYPRELLMQTLMLAEVVSEQGHLDAADSMMERVGHGFRALVDSPSLANDEDYLVYLLTHAEIAHRLGENRLAAHLLEQVIEPLSRNQDAISDQSQARLQVTAAYLWWLASGVLRGKELPAALSMAPQESEYMSCETAYQRAEVAIMNGNETEARTQARFLNQKGYAKGDFQRFCDTHEVCD